MTFCSASVVPSPNVGLMPNSAGAFKACIPLCRCQGCLAVILEQMQFLNNSAIHGGGVDINASLPTPIIITASQFTYNSARVVIDAQGNSSVRATLAGNGGGIRCLGGERAAAVHALLCLQTPAAQAPDCCSLVVNIRETLCWHT